MGGSEGDYSSTSGTMLTEEFIPFLIVSAKCQENRILNLVNLVVSTKKLHIFLADDDNDDCFLFEEALKELPISFQLKILHNGDQIMKVLEDTPKDQLPDMVFLDLNMPRKSGLECLSEIKKSDKLKELSVIIFSTSLEIEMANLLYKKGALFCVRKPTVFSQIKNVLYQAITFIEENDVLQPPREKFVLSGDLKKSIN